MLFEGYNIGASEKCREAIVCPFNELVQRTEREDEGISNQKGSGQGALRRKRSAADNEEERRGGDGDDDQWEEPNIRDLCSKEIVCYW